MFGKQKTQLNGARANTGRNFFAVVLLFVSVIVTSLFASSIQTADAAIPKYINFQGKLTAVSNGSNVANGNYTFQFKLYDASSGGSLLWTETWDGSSGPCPELTVAQGVFNAKLGACNSLASVDFTGGALYLSVNFDPGSGYDGEMSPRKQLVSSAYSFISNGVSGDGRVNVTPGQSATALTVARSGTDYAFQVDTNTASSATGLKVTSAAAAGGLALNVISSGANENLTLDAKGSGTISLGATSTGDILLGGGSGSTGCTVTNSTGAFDCAGGGSFFPSASSNLTVTNSTAASSNGVLKVNATVASNNVPGIFVNYSTSSVTGSGANMPGIQNTVSSSAIVAGSGVGQNVYGIKNTLTKTGADTATGTYNMYGTYSTVSNTGRTDTGTVNSYAGYFVSAGDTAGTSTTYGLYANAVNADTNYGIWVDASGGTNNYAAIFNTGNVGIGDSSPVALFTVGSGDLFQVNSSGAIAAATGVTSSGTITFSGLGGGGTQCVNVNNSGVLGTTTCGGALTPWTSDIDADGYDLNDLSNILFRETTGAPTGSDVAIFRDNSGDLNANVLTAKTFNVQVNGTDEYNFSSTALALNSNNITGIGTALTATAGVTLSSTSANLVLQSSTSGDIILSPAGKVGVGDATPNSLFTVGSGDLFQINSTGQIGSQQAPVSDYLFALAGTSSNDHSRVIDITQANNAAEDSRVISIVNTASPTTQTGGSRTIENIYTSLTPVMTVNGTAGAPDVNFFGSNNNLNISSVSLGDTTVGAVQLYAHGDASIVTFSPTLNDTDGTGGYFLNGYGGNFVMQGSPTYTNVAGSADITTYGSSIRNTFASAGNANASVISYGAYMESSGNLTTTGFTQHFGGFFSTGGTADINYGIYSDVSGATTNYAAILLGGNVGIGTSGPDRKLDVLDSSSPQLRLTTTDGSVYSDLQNSANINLAVSGSTLAASSGLQYGVQINPTINQSSTAGYTGLLVNPTQTANGSGVNNIADFQTSSSSKLAVRNDGSILMNGNGIINTPFGGYGAYQNYLVQSENFATTWTTSSISAISADGQTAPDGTTTAESLATSGSGGYVQQDTSTAVSSTTYTFSVWARSASGTQTFGMRIDGTTTGTGTEKTFTATTSWQRFYVTQSVAAFTGNVRVRIYPGTTANTGTIYAWGAQLDNASVPSLYAKTTSAALTNAASRGLIVNTNLTNTTASGFAYGERHINVINSSTAGTHVGQFIRMVDNTSLDSGQNVRGLEVQAYSGTNVNGTNTGIASYGYTFGIQATTTAQAAAQASPAAVFADLDNGTDSTTKARGNAIRAYTNDATSADLVSFYQETSTYTGSGLLMNFGNSGGSFSGNFLNLQNAGTSKLTVASTGRLDINVADADNATALYINTEESTTTQVVFGIESDTSNGSGADTLKFKITADGATYNDPGTFTTPADVAEMYNAVGNLEPGDIVEMTAASGFADGTNFGVKKHEPNSPVAAMGVVSTKPGQVLGYQWKRPEVVAQQKPIALAGRVPVKVTNENGVIEPGDFLTASTTMPGYAMKALKAGSVIGQALESFSGGVGKIEVFVKATDYSGVSIEEVVAGLNFDYAGYASGTEQGLENAEENSAKILEHLLAQLPNLDSNNLSQVSTDVVIAAGEIVSPTVTTQTLRADFLTSATSEGGLSVASTTMFAGGLTVDNIGAIGDLLTFSSDVEFFGTPYFTKDTAGFAVVNAGVQSVDILFEREYLAQPIVNATVSFEQDVDQSLLDEDARKLLKEAAVAEAQNFLADPVSFVVTNKSKYGFTIVLNKTFDRDIKLSWTALAVRNATTFMSLEPDENNAPVVGDNSGSGNEGNNLTGDSGSEGGSEQSGGTEMGSGTGDGSGQVGDGGTGDSQG